MNIAITPPLQRLIDRVYPGMSPRQQAGQLRELLHDVLLDQIPTPTPTATGTAAPAEPEQESCTKAANRIANMAPAIDDQNWAKLEANIHTAQQAGLYDMPTELRLIGRLNDPFDGAENEHRVQNSRITAFFRRLLAC